MTLEKHEFGTRSVEFEMPTIQLESFQPSENEEDLDRKLGMIERFSISTSRRQFILKENWEITLEGFHYLPDYGENRKQTIVIPCTDENGDPIRFDGASIPFPWIVSFLTLGIFRPLGVMLIGSIVHDYMFQTGRLCIKKSDSDELDDKGIDRHIADRLFKDIINTINKLVSIGWIGWFFVRLGWFGVRYNKKSFWQNLLTERPPYIPTIIFIGFVIGAYSTVQASGWSPVLLTLLLIYLILFIVGWFTRQVIDR